MWQSPFGSSSGTEEPRDFWRSQLRGLLSHCPPNLLASPFCCGHRLGQVGRPEGSGGRWREGGEGLLASPGGPWGKGHTCSLQQAGGWLLTPLTPKRVRGPGAPLEQWASTWSFSRRKAPILCSAIRQKSATPPPPVHFPLPKKPLGEDGRKLQAKKLQLISGRCDDKREGTQRASGALGSP